MADFLLCKESLNNLKDSPEDETSACQGKPEEVSDDDYEDNDNDCYWEDSVQQEEDIESSESEEVSKLVI